MKEAETKFPEIKEWMGGEEVEVAYIAFPSKNISMNKKGDLWQSEKQVDQGRCFWEGIGGAWAYLQKKTCKGNKY